MEEDVLNALQTRTAYLPGGFDCTGKIIFIVNISGDLQLWNRKCLELTITYLRNSLSSALLAKGVSVIVDAQKCSSRITRTHSRVIYSLFGETEVSLYLVRSEGFWEKHVEPCTKSHTNGEPIVLSKTRLNKYFDTNNLPPELGGTLQFNYDLWLQQRKSIDEFQKSYGQTLNDLENLQVLLVSSKTLRPSDSEQELRKCTQLHAAVQRQIEAAIEMGNNILLRLTEAYCLPSQPHADEETATSLLNPTAAATTTNATTLTSITRPDTNHHHHTTSSKPRLPPDLCCERNRIELHLNEIERRQTAVRSAWLELLQSIRESRELATLEEGVTFVTNWILSTAEQLLSRQQAVGCDVRACEELRTAHDALELECRETYGFYAELLYKIDTYAGPKDSFTYKDVLSQRDFMQFVCRSFATRLERRRNVLITSLRFYRLVSEYFDRTSAVFESLVMGNKMQELEAAADNLQRLKDSQTSLAKLECELTREGEKLSDMLAMPVKDALGRDLHVDYSDDIASIRDILDTTAARRSIFSDSVELQKLTLQQLTHIHAYEQDARVARQWMDDLYEVMLRCHSHVGCNIHEIQVQKDELQSFQETGKSIYQYGSQLLQASRALRLSCKLCPEAPQLLLQQLERTWHSLQAVSQEHMTRLRVSAVFHRSVEEYSNQLLELRSTVMSITHSGSSSSGVSSENESHSSPEMTARSGMVAQSHTIELPKKDYKTSGRRGRRHQLRKCLEVREQLLLEVGRMVRLGRLLKTRLKEPFVLDVTTGKSIMLDDLSHNVTSPSTDSGNGGSELNTTTTTTDTSTAADTTVIVTPTGNNVIACNAISSKLKDISEVAESLDSVIREVQEEALLMDTHHTSSARKPKNPARSIDAATENDCFSRSTEDESFVTVSEGNFTPCSHSSSFQTASGRTLSFNASGNSFDEADDCTLNAFEMPETTSLPQEGDVDHNYLGSEQTSPSPTTPPPPTVDGAKCRIIPIEIEDVDSHSIIINDDQSSVVDIEELHSRSVTPSVSEDRPPLQSIPIVECDAAPSCIVDAPSMEILTEVVPLTTSVTPEVSHTCPSASGQLTNTNKPNAAWRRNKYYENITKQTIKGFL